ncbi:MAG: hypothetical protein BWX62_00958 [Bacteroidetes bacterium ADurb.Bin037]|nr:MAG: hypothetical protein BWX62_00958 [Bacteroidetes bacterium ADurb.Bin037]
MSAHKVNIFDISKFYDLHLLLALDKANKGYLGAKLISYFNIYITEFEGVDTHF